MLRAIAKIQRFLSLGKELMLCQLLHVLIKMRTRHAGSASICW